MKTYEIETETKYGKYIFLTKANNGKDALNNLIQNSCDFKNIITKQDSDNMVIHIKQC